MNDNEPGELKTASRLDTLLKLLESDPNNLSLIADAADTALSEHNPRGAADLLNRYAEHAALPPRETNLAGLAAMQLRDFHSATGHFASLINAGWVDPAVRFNLAWSRAMLKDFGGALQLLDEDVARTLPQAAMLKIQILHERGDLDEATACVQNYLQWHPDHRGLMAAMSVLALDVEDLELAAQCAAKAGDHPDALATLGALALGDERATEALDIFDRALARNPSLPRAWVGRGLAKLLTGNSSSAPADIERGAEMFGDHLGSWIAAGWAHFVNHDLVASRARFETAIEIDPTFAETHGSLAVLDIMEGKLEEGKERSETALRLDRQCYSAALAKVLLAVNAGDQAQARRIYEVAINTPVDESGRTIAQALAKLGMISG